MKRYYITDRRRCPSDLLDCIEENARRGVQWVQVREKDLGVRDLLALVRAAVDRVRPWQARVLVNGRLDVALAAGAHGVHLPSRAPPVSAMRRIAPEGFLIGVSTHIPAEVVRAEREGADLAVFGPVFPTVSKPGLLEIPGLDGLREVCGMVRMPVAALGGVTEARSSACRAAGAAAIAGIGMFQAPGIAGDSR
ncbi:MAG: thiamine phosphate synthase [Bryobacterales bacterium]|nr:thiamine phosphate synthase [Bryobacterales bacterium]MDE0627851.1 thiamine phosphate synthase [Bryobacterales bacterium]